MAKKVLLVVFLTLVCSSCYIRTGWSTVAGYGTDVNWEIETYPVESGIGDGYGRRGDLSAICYVGLSQNQKTDSMDVF